MESIEDQKWRFKKEKKIKRQEYLAVEKVFYYILHLAHTFEYSSWYYSTCDWFLGCYFQNEEKNYCFIYRFKVRYYPGGVIKNKNTKK